MVIQSLHAALTGYAVAGTIYAGTVEAMVQAGCVEAYGLERADGIVPDATLMRFLPRPSDGIDTLPDEIGLERHPYFFAGGDGPAWQLFHDKSSKDGPVALSPHRGGRVLAHVVEEQRVRRVFRERFLGTEPVRIFGGPSDVTVYRFDFPGISTFAPTQLLGPQGVSAGAVRLVRMNEDRARPLITSRRFVIPARP